MKHPLIFLDIDWVIVKYNENNYILDDILVSKLKEIIDKTWAKIIISSDRRFDLELLNSEFTKNNLKYSDTTSLDNELKDFTIKWMTKQREEDIIKYITKNNISKYVILDDLNLKLDNFYKTNPNIGITNKIKDDIINFLISI